MFRRVDGKGYVAQLVEQVTEKVLLLTSLSLFEPGQARFMQFA